jgi:hypothetical protein
MSSGLLIRENRMLVSAEFDPEKRELITFGDYINPRDLIPYGSKGIQVWWPIGQIHKLLEGYYSDATEVVRSEGADYGIVSKSPQITIGRKGTTETSRIYDSISLFLKKVV